MSIMPAEDLTAAPAPAANRFAGGHQNETLESILRDFENLKGRLERFMQDHKRRMDDLKRSIGG